jgi:hypothetical protein
MIRALRAVLTAALLMMFILRPPTMAMVSRLRGARRDTDRTQNQHSCKAKLSDQNEGFHNGISPCSSQLRYPYRNPAKRSFHARHEPEMNQTFIPIQGRSSDSHTPATQRVLGSAAPKPAAESLS